MELPNLTRMLVQLAEANGYTLKPQSDWPNLDTYILLEKQAGRFNECETEVFVDGSDVEAMILMVDKSASDLDDFLNSAFDGALHSDYYLPF